VLVGTVATGAFHACVPSDQADAVSTSNVYANDSYIAGAGYYHAPFRAWYPMPYNSYDAGRKMYYYGGRWAPAPYESVVNLSSPTAEAVRQEEATRSNVTRGGFGSSSRSSYISS
jgi:hypothetical protein